MFSRMQRNDDHGYTVMVVDEHPGLALGLRSNTAAEPRLTEWLQDPWEALRQVCRKPYDCILIGDCRLDNGCPEWLHFLQNFCPLTKIVILAQPGSFVPTENLAENCCVVPPGGGLARLASALKHVLDGRQPIRQSDAYQQGILRILDLLPELYESRSWKMVAELILRYINKTLQIHDCFILLKPSLVLPPQISGEFAADLFLGSGRFALDYEHFSTAASEELVRALDNVIYKSYIVQNEDLMLLPVTVRRKLVGGVLGVSSADFPSGLMVHLLNYCVELATGAFYNSLLRLMLYKQESWLNSADRHLAENYLQTVEMMRHMVEAKDIYTRGHSDRVAYYAVKLAAKVEPDTAFLERVRIAGLLHDVGKIGTAEAILCKKGRLTEAEMAEIRKHPAAGALILEQNDMFRELGPIISAHHERYDGQGYPEHLQGLDIPLEARIISIADAFDAMMSDRHYRNSLSLEQAVRELINGSDTQFDGELVDIFLAILSDYERMREDLLWTTETLPVEEAAGLRRGKLRKPGRGRGRSLRARSL